VPAKLVAVAVVVPLGIRVVVEVVVAPQKGQVPWVAAVAAVPRRTILGSSSWRTMWPTAVSTMNRRGVRAPVDRPMPAVGSSRGSGPRRRGEG
jgi:hypothetical protein